jgi:hypothetical protein
MSIRSSTGSRLRQRMKHTGGLRAEVAAPSAGMWSDPVTGPALCAWMQRHFLALAVVAEQNGRRELFFYTGFVVERHKRLHWITAGHCIEQLEQLRSSSEWTIKIAHWHDNYPDRSAAVRPASIVDMVWKHGDLAGADFGVVWLRPNDADCLRANRNFSPFTAGAWTANPRSKPAGLFLFGYPQSARSESRSMLGTREHLIFRQSFVGMPLAGFVDRNKMDDGGSFWSHHQSIYGQLAIPQDEAWRNIKDIRGMSGGAIVSLDRRRDGHVGYRLLAVQSSWDRKHCIIRAEPISLVVAYLDYVYSEVRRRARRSSRVRSRVAAARTTSRRKRT